MKGKEGGSRGLGEGGVKGEGVSRGKREGQRPRKEGHLKAINALPDGSEVTVQWPSPIPHQAGISEMETRQ